MGLTKQQRVLAIQRRHEDFTRWVDILRSRASVQNVDTERISESEWKEYEKPTEPFK